MSTQGLLERPNGFYFQARIPKKYHSHYLKTNLREKLPTENRKEAIALVRKRWAELHKEFERIDSSDTKFKTIISDTEADYLIKLAIHTRLSADNEIRELGIEEDTYERLEHYYEEADNREKLVVSRGQLTPLAIDIVSDWLRGHNYDLAEDCSQFRAFALKFIKAQIVATKAIGLRQQGVPSETPPPPVKESITSSELASLEDLRDYWMTQPSKSTGIKKGRTSKSEADNVIKKFRSMVGDFKPNEVTEEHIVSLKDKMLAEGSSPATINKSRGVLAAMFSTAKGNKKLTVNPCIDMEKLLVPMGEVEKPYTLLELQTIFNSKIYTEGYRPKRFNGEASYWLPLLGLYTGARLNEVGQLFSEDVGEEDGIHFIKIKPEIATYRTNKTGTSRRVPIHPDLIKMGFLDYCNNIKSQNIQQLFPELKVTRTNGKVADKWSQEFWNKYIRNELNIKRIPQPFHGLRHSFIANGRRCKLDSELRRLIEGHTANSVDMKSYGDSLYPLEPLYDEIVKLNFKGLDLTHLYIGSSEEFPI